MIRKLKNQESRFHSKVQGGKGQVRGSVMEGVSHVESAGSENDEIVSKEEAIFFI